MTQTIKIAGRENIEDSLWTLINEGFNITIAGSMLEAQRRFPDSKDNDEEIEVFKCDKCLCVHTLDFYYCPNCGEKANS